MPKLWNKTIGAHRNAVRDAALDAAAAIVTQRGLRAVTMSEIAEITGIGRATLYKYFPDVEAILIAWHERMIAQHLTQLGEIRAQPGAASARLAAVLEAYALMTHARRDHGSDLTTLLHRGRHVAKAHQKLTDFIRDLVAEGARTRELRDDVAPGELASFCLHAIAAAGAFPSKAAVHRLVKVILTGIRR